MSEEEQEAIEYIKNIKSWWWNNSPNRVYTINKNDIEQFDIIINLIEKQQKEIKRLTDENNFLKEMYRGTTEYKTIKKKVEELGWN